MKRSALGGRGVWLGAAWLLLGACGQSAGPIGGGDAEHRTAAPLLVTRGNLEDRVVLTGELEAVNSESLRVPRTPSWLLSIIWLADDGSTVKKGDRVVEFDAAALAETLQDKRGAVLRAENELASQLAQASADLADKVMQVERVRAELEKKEIEAKVPADLEPGRKHQENQLAVAAQRDALAKAQEDLVAQKRTAQLARTVKEVERARAARDLSELEKRLEELTLRATRDGLVQMGTNPLVGRKYLAADQAMPGWVVASLPELATMQVHARLSDVDDGAVRTGMAAECILDAYPGRSWKGTIDKVSPMARSEGRDAARRFFDVLVALSSSAPELMRPGMSVRVEVIRRRATSALLLPRAALRDWPGASRVRRTNGALQPVGVDFCAELLCAVRDGLAEGTPLLAAGPPESAAW